MKLILIVLCCILVTFELNSAEDKVEKKKDFFQKLHDAGEKIKSDVHKFSEKVKADFEKIVHPQIERRNKGLFASPGKVWFKNEEDEEVPVFATSSSKPPTTTQDTGSMMVFPTEEPEVTTRVVPTTVAPEPVTTKSNNATDKEGKEALTGGCLPGYRRTADGRCMPTY